MFNADSSDISVTITRTARTEATSEQRDNDSEVDEFESLLQQLTASKLDPQATANALASELTSSADLEGELSALWGSILEVAHANPEQHSQLVSTMIHLASLPDVLGKDGKVFKVYNMILWRDMPMWGWSINDEWNHLDVPSDPGPARDEAISAWHAQNRFSALLFQTGVASLQAPLQALWSFRSALEDDNEPRDLDIHIPAAAVWIEVAGEMVRSCNEQFPPAGGAEPGKGGRRWNGQHGFCHGRWELWKERFGAIGDEGGVNDETRGAARSAAQKMEELDASA